MLQITPDPSKGKFWRCSVQINIFVIATVELTIHGYHENVIYSRDEAKEKRIK